MSMIGLADIREAQDRIAGSVFKTPLVSSPRF
jgi:threonine dehydratase